MATNSKPRTPKQFFKKLKATKSPAKRKAAAKKYFAKARARKK